jgi:hypothetical protein
MNLSLYHKFSCYIYCSARIESVRSEQEFILLLVLRSGFTLQLKMVLHRTGFRSKELEPKPSRALPKKIY